jgi:hypothetical protein
MIYFHSFLIRVYFHEKCSKTCYSVESLLRRNMSYHVELFVERLRDFGSISSWMLKDSVPGVLKKFGI